MKSKKEIPSHLSPNDRGEANDVVFYDIKNEPFTIHGLYDVKNQPTYKFWIYTKTPRAGG